MGFRTVCMAGIRCPTMMPRLDDLLAEARAYALAYFGRPDLKVGYHVYGRDGVMGPREKLRNSVPHELGLVIDVLADDQELAHAACHLISGRLLHAHYPGIINTSGNLAFLYSPSELDAGPAYAFSAYHLMKVASPLELFPMRIEDL
jgi:hypothetical protein